MNRKPFRRATDAERRDDLIVATLDCIAEGGLASATVRQVAERAGVSGGLIRHYFASKDLLLQAAYRRIMGRMTAIACDAADVGETPADRLRAFIVASLSPPMIDARMLGLWAAFIAQVRVDPAMEAIHREAYVEFRSAIEIILADAFAAAGRPVGAAECRRLATRINAVLDGLWLEGCLAHSLFNDEELKEAGIESVEAITGIGLKQDHVRE
ncbi:TetR family transcriptional regulator C-terminal domain-containing protein [Martelella sp. HB161492]|uniref:TetR/AcrR family transcriptional regulator n=1 Tax=Martelella sp. HB161492 TaxID=2720726 RepID=UPI0015913483|nr:TetR family transcriptional regulator C-terminal domain-containing protein [Martelella sp. HB161492]